MSKNQGRSDGSGNTDDSGRIQRPVNRRSILRFGAAAATVAAAYAVPGIGVKRAFAEGSGGKPVIELKFGHPYNVKHPLAKGAEKFAKLVSERTNGQVKISIYPNSTIGASQSLVNSMQIGAVDLALEIGRAWCRERVCQYV